MFVNKIYAALAVALFVGAITFLATPSQEEVATYGSADAASALSNLSSTLEALIDPIVTLATIVIVFALVMGVLAKIKGWFRF